MLVPIISIAWLALSYGWKEAFIDVSGSVWQRYLKDTMILLLSVGGVSGIIGICTAWFVTIFKFPGHRFFEWSLLAPLAIPGYISAYAIVDFFEYSGFLQLNLRQIFGWTAPNDYWFPDIRTMGGAIMVLSFSLYPYVYFLTRTALLEHSDRFLQAAKILGCGAVKRFLHVAIPLSRPAIVAGIAMILMEVLNDFGAVEHFSISTLTVGIFTMWFENHNVQGVAQLSLVLLLLSVILLSFERFSRKKAQFYSISSEWNVQKKENSGIFFGSLMCIFCAITLFFGFILPFSIIIVHSMKNVNIIMSVVFLKSLLNTIYLASFTTVISLFVAAIMVYGARILKKKEIIFLTRISSLGYAVPSAVLAIGVLLPFTKIDKWLIQSTPWVLGIDITSLLLTGSIGAIIFAFVVRFNTVAYSALDGAFGRISPNITYAAQVFGKGRSEVLLRVNLPLIKPTMLAAAILIFVDSTKELSATLILQPFNFSTLSTQVYQYASLEQLGHAAPAALTISTLSLIPVVILSRFTNSARRQNALL
jgi:iron(III) transport system permease protein